MDKKGLLSFIVFSFPFAFSSHLNAHCCLSVSIMDVCVLCRMQYYPACRAGNWFTVEILVHIFAAEEFVDILGEYRKKLRRLLKCASLDEMKLVSRPENCISNVISSLAFWDGIKCDPLFYLFVCFMYFSTLVKWKQLCTGVY